MKVSVYYLESSINDIWCKISMNIHDFLLPLYDEYNTPNRASLYSKYLNIHTMDIGK